MADVAGASLAQAEAAGVAEGVLLARTLVNEPANVLTPVEFARRAAKLASLGVEVEILDEKALAELGMRALLGVGQGSSQESQVVVLRWNGGPADAAPLAFIGKGVVFDSGGISIKPAASMEDMKGDMAGAAAVTGLLHALASRKAKANVIGVLGLVENMPDGEAQRPGDIVKSMSGQTIEIINTDAEGRLVLADALWYVKEEYKPAFMIDLATLTGAILVALGQEYAGLFSNNDELAGRLTKAGEATGEKLWRMPMGPAFDKMIDSRFADMKNTGGRHAGSITAAQFLQRFVDKTPVGASRHRRHGHEFARGRHQPELGLRLGRAAARPAGAGFLRRLRASRSLAIHKSERRGHNPHPALDAIRSNDLAHDPLVPSRAALRRGGGRGGRCSRARRLGVMPG